MAALVNSCGYGQQEIIPELTLEQAIDLALHNNADSRKAQLETNRMSRDLAANRTKRLASIQLIALGSVLLTKPSISFAEGSFGTFPATGPIPAKDQTIMIARKPVGVIYATVSQPLSTQYKLHLQLKELELQVEETREDERKQRLSTIDQVRRDYYDIVKAQSQLDAAKGSLPYYQESKRLAGEKIRQETILESDLLEVDVQLVKTQNSVSDDSDQLEKAVEKLNDAMGRDIHLQFRVTNVLEIEAESETPASIEARALENRPDIKKAKLQVRAADYDSRAKKAEYIPDISLAFDYVTTTNFGSTLPSNITTAGLQVNWEPWDWGRRRQELAEKRIQEEEAKVSVGSTVRSALMEVRNAWRQTQSARRSLTLAEVNEREARQRLRETQEKVNVEQVLTKDLFSAEANLASADDQYRQVLALFWSARADLKKAIGEE